MSERTIKHIFSRTREDSNATAREPVPGALSVLINENTRMVASVFDGAPWRNRTPISGFEGRCSIR